MARASLRRHDAHRPTQINVLEDAFRLFDKDGDGNITSSELQSVMQSLGQPVDIRQATEMIMSVDKDGNGLIDFDEFCEMMSGRLPSSSSAGVDQLGGDFRSLFMAFDKDNSGYIDADELRQTMSAVGLQLTDGDVRVMMNAAGVPAGGRIYYEDFQKMMTHQLGQSSQCCADCSTSPSENSRRDDLCGLSEAFSLFDKDGDGQITVDEVAQTMSSLGIDVRLCHVQTMVDQVDTDGQN